MIAAVVIALLVGGAMGVVIGSLRRNSPSRLDPRDAIGVRPPVEGSPTVDEPDGIGRTLRAAVDQLSLGVVVGDADGRIVYRNAAAAALRGTHAGVIIEEHVDQVLAAGRSGVRIDDEFVLHGPPKVMLQLTAEPMPGGFSVATIEDVSERNRIASMRTDFVANISHELKTPVGAIAVLAEALFGEDDEAVITRVAGRMVDEAHRAVAAIDDLLELARIESAPRLDEEVVLADVVASAIARGRVVDAAKNVQVTAFDSAERIVVRCDSRQLVSAIGNLVENAVKYSGDDGVVQVRTRRDDRGVEVMVADQGDGIPARDLDRIFERFYRVDRARSRVTGGTGLGLSIVRHVASNHGGEVLVSSTEGEGSTFVLRLPASLLVSPDPGGDRHARDHESPTQAEPRTEGHTT
ncbi:MAG: ATP-binding protein [Ilumatobacter sp.]|uniref:sensor histidine kinase n=1 Tax=Ilumatobacter sp. TaxID=1967498 RepID=UPI003298955A